MIQSNLKTVFQTNRGSMTGNRRAPYEDQTVARYRLLLVKEDEEPVSELESLTRPAEVAAFLWERVFAGLDREAMCAVYADNLCRVIGWTVAYVGCLTRCSVEPRGLVVPALLSNAATRHRLSSPITTPAARRNRAPRTSSSPGGWRTPATCWA